MADIEHQQSSSKRIHNEHAKVSSQKRRDKEKENSEKLRASLLPTPYASKNVTKADLLLNAALCINRLSEENKRLNKEKEEYCNNIKRLLTLNGEREILINKREYVLNEVNIDEVVRLSGKIEILDNELNKLNVLFNEVIHK
ncbi:24409_t:CDS:2 [Cetraspora pellucida]|uniref:24409_t:CDS:1 n=1 Tax=Cetraspora pellucida TaxID=1433469 RepID=A0A9N9ERQ3_9GLOM|nr:24409_t:CDS:2 [Cetraspora pellucida]